MEQLQWSVAWKLPPKVSVELLYDPGIPLLGVQTESSR